MIPIDLVLPTQEEDIDALVAALVVAGADQPLQLLVEDELDGRLHRATDARVEVDEEVGTAGTSVAW